MMSCLWSRRTSKLDWHLGWWWLMSWPCQHLLQLLLGPGPLLWQMPTRYCLWTWSIKHAVAICWVHDKWFLASCCMAHGSLLRSQVWKGERPKRTLGGGLACIRMMCSQTVRWPHASLSEVLPQILLQNGMAASRSNWKLILFFVGLVV